MNHKDTKSEARNPKSETNSKIKFSNAPNEVLLLMPKAAIRIVQCSAGVGGGKKVKSKKAKVG